MGSKYWKSADYSLLLLLSLFFLLTLVVSGLHLFLFNGIVSVEAGFPNELGDCIISSLHCSAGYVPHFTCCGSHPMVGRSSLPLSLSESICRTLIEAKWSWASPVCGSSPEVTVLLELLAALGNAPRPPLANKTCPKAGTSQISSLLPLWAVSLFADMETTRTVKKEVRERYISKENVLAYWLYCRQTAFYHVLCWYQFTE